MPSERTPSNSTPGDSPLKPQKPSITRPNSALIDLSENGNDYIVSTAPPLKASKSSKSVPTRVDSRHSSASSSLRPTPTKSSSNPQQAFPQSKSTPILTETSFEAIVIYPFQAEGDELALELGQIVVVSRTTGRGNESADESWWFGEHTRSGNSGWFPSNFVRRRA